VGEPNDQYEQEADRVAETVVAQLQAMGDADSNDNGNNGDDSIIKLQRKPLFGSILQKLAVQRAVAEEEEILMKSEQGETATASDAIESTINQKKGSGSALPDIFRSKVEQAIGADFSGVRVHTDQESDTLNRSLSARAFTTGNDIFFKQGEYNPTSSEGQKLITHELTHTIQQGASSHVGQMKIQRLTFENTQWESAKSAKISSGGGGGAIFIKDKGDPVVVKPAEEQAEESILFSELFQQTMGGAGLDQAGGKKGKNWKAVAPGVRKADPAECARIKNVLDRLLPNDDSDRRIAGAKQKLSGNDANCTVYAYAQGENFSDFTGNITDNESQKEFDSRMKVFSQLWEDTGMLTLLARVTTIDMFTGNFDRMLLFNPENFMVQLKRKQNTITFIDNIYDAPGQGGTFGSEGTFREWIAKQVPVGDDVVNCADILKNREFNRLAIAIVANLKYWFQGMRNDFRDMLQNAVNEHKDQMINTLTEGMASTFAPLRSALTNLANEGKKGELEGRDKDVMTNLIARKNYISGLSADVSWQKADEVMNPNQQPVVNQPAQQPQQRQWVRGVKPDWV